MEKGEIFSRFGAQTKHIAVDIFELHFIGLRVVLWFPENFHAFRNEFIEKRRVPQSDPDPNGRRLRFTLAKHDGTPISRKTRARSRRGRPSFGRIPSS